MAAWKKELKDARSTCAFDHDKLNSTVDVFLRDYNFFCNADVNVLKSIAVKSQFTW